MPVDAVSLYGFMAESEAVQYLEDACILEPDADPARLWSDARAKLGRATPGAGVPEVRPMPTHYKARLDAVRSEPWFEQFVADSSWEFALVEIAPLIAFQFQIMVEHSDAQCAAVGSPPSMGEMLALCLPRDRKSPDIRIDAGDKGLVISSPDLNVFTMGPLWADLPADGAFRGALIAGPVVRTRVPTVQVARVNGRHYLRNGYHRVYCIGRRGAEYVPCVVLDFDTPDQAIGDIPGFSRNLLESRDPPTLAHFVGGRAADVRMQRLQQVIAVSWTEATIREGSSGRAGSR